MYSLITSGMTWSYSRISTFNSCPYKFFLTYIAPCEKSRLFFSDYGSFVHELLASYYSGASDRQNVVMKYLTSFSNHVVGKAPDQNIFGRYFRQGLAHLKGLEKPAAQVLGVEQFVSFQVGTYPFVGYVDLILRDADNGEITVRDHKSRSLKPRSTRGKRTKSDAELDSYLRQLYLYSIPIERTYGVLPAYLELNCYRSGSVIREAFSQSAYLEAQSWASRSVESIIRTEDFHPNMDYYYCKYICDVHDSCEYYALQS